MHNNLLTVVAAAGLASAAQAAPQIYNIDSSHTYPSFEAPHVQQLSLWRGKFNKTTGTMTLDREAKTGSVDITVDTSTLDFGHEAMNKMALGADYFNVEKYPNARYKGTIQFAGDQPVQVKGELTLVGVTKPLNLKINWLRCMPHRAFKREVCGTDAYAEFNRGDWGMMSNIDYGPMVMLRISAEAVMAEQQAGAAPGRPSQGAGVPAT